MKKDYYAILGVSRNASAKEITIAFRKLAQEHHPDVAKGEKISENKFAEINEAYEILSDDSKRKAYDEAQSNALVSNLDTDVGEVVDEYLSQFHQ